MVGPPTDRLAERSTTITVLPARTAPITPRIKPVEIVARLVCVVTMRRLAIALSACLGACGDNRAGFPEPDSDGGPFQTAPHAPLPVVFPHHGVVLSSMQLVTVTYADYARAADAVEFSDALVGSGWYRAIGAEYRTLTASHVQHVTLGDAPAALSRGQITAMFTDLVAHDPSVTKPTETGNQVLYLLYVPPSVERGTGLVGIRGYHEVVTVDRVKFPIAVVLDDGDLPATTKRAGHQVINAATNPYKDGYYADPPQTDPLRLLRGEIADLCEGEDAVVEAGFAFPRVYSNAAAIAGLPPCWPLQPGDSWSDVTAEPSQIQTVLRGGTVKFTLTGWSTSPLPDWKIRVDVAEFSNLSADEMLPTLTADTINNNHQVTLSLRVPFEAASGATGGVQVLSGENGRPWAVGFKVK